MKNHIAGAEPQSALLSYFGRVTYDFEDKYLFTGIVRVDGSSRFGENNRFGVPSSPPAGQSSREPFLEGNEVLDFLKVRASCTRTATRRSATTAGLPPLPPAPAIPSGDGTVFTSGSVPATVPNPRPGMGDVRTDRFWGRYALLRGKISRNGRLLHQKRPLACWWTPLHPASSAIMRQR